MKNNDYLVSQSGANLFALLTRSSTWALIGWKREVKNKLSGLKILLGLFRYNIVFFRLRISVVHTWHLLQRMVHCVLFLVRS